MDVVWLASLALASGGLHASARLASLAVLVVAALLLLVRARPWLAAAVVALFALGAARADTAIERHARASASAPRALPGAPRLLRCSVRGRVAQSPVRVSAAGDAAARLTLDQVELACEGARAPHEEPRALEGRVVVHAEWAAAGDLVRGDAVELFANLAEPQRFVVPELGDERAGRARGLVVLSGGAVDVVRFASGAGPPAWIDRARAHVRARILATFPPRAEPLARALVLGESDLTPEDAREFRDGGLSHLLAVSGMHLVLTVNSVVALLTAGLARLRWLALRVVPRRAASLVGLVICWIYCDFSGGSGSAVRAAWMLSAQLLAAALGRRVRPLRALGWSVLLMALQDPLVAVDVSFALSAAATLGLVVLGGPLSERLATRGPALARLAGKSFATTLAATLPCAPILLRMGPALSLGGLVANVLAVPVGETAALPLCLAHGLLAPLPRAERGAALAGGGALLVVGRIAHVTAASRLGRVALPRPSDAELALLASLALVLSLAPRVAGDRVRRVAAVSALLGLGLAEGVARRAGAPRGAVRVTFLDVGQGDAALIDLPSGEAILIDAGGLVGSQVDPGERVLAPLLRARRRGALAAVIVSHPHPDHFMGLRAGLEGVRVGEVWDTGEAERSEPFAAPGPFGPVAYQAALRGLEASGARVRRPPELCGSRMFGGVELTVLAPCPSFAEGRGTNDNSFVVRLRYGARTFLFVGDAEHAAEAELLANTRAGALRADVLKVGHHGSRTSSTSDFVAAVAPRFAVISCGNRNRYGHPHLPALERLAARGSALLRTDCHGTITASTDGQSLELVPAANGGCP